MLESQNMPLFQCPICGYECDGTWESESDAAWYAAWYCAGQLVMAMLRTLLLRTLCVHPDGSGAYGGRNSGLRSTTTRNPITLEAVIQEYGTNVPPVNWINSLGRDVPDPAQVESFILFNLAGPIAKQFLTYASPVQYPAEFLRVYELLPNDQIGQDATLKHYQDRVIDLLCSVYGWLESIAYILEEQHAMTAAEAYAFMDEGLLEYALRKAGVRFSYHIIRKDGEDLCIECIDGIEDEDEDDYA